MIAPAEGNRGRDDLLRVSHLHVDFSVGWGRPPLHAVDDVSLTIGPKETVGLVGESGSGKTTLGRAILGLAPIAAGSIEFDRRDITNLRYKDRRRLSRQLQVVFQDPYSSLNPTRTIGQTLSEPLRAHESLNSADTAQRVTSMLLRVGLPPDAVTRYPAHFSGGQRQRIAIARALMLRPRLVICDEPVSSLDLSVQAQVLNLLRELQAELDLSYLFIAHDLAVVRHLSHRIVVLYRGQIMEVGPAAEVYERPAHPYTRVLLDACLVPDPVRQRRRRNPTKAANTNAGTERSDGCPFAPRCDYATQRCWSERPRLEQRGRASTVACHHWRELRRGGASPKTEAAHS